jgi:hypothetical protein
MRRSPLLVLSSLCACFLLSFLTPAMADDEKEKVAVDPYRFKPLVDARGKKWDIRDDGSITDGSNDCFDGAFDMMIESNRLRYYYQRKLNLRNRGGGIWFQQGNTYIIGPLEMERIPSVKGISITRYISLTSDKKWLRYIDVFENNGTAEVKLSYQVRLDFGSAIQSVKGNNGRDNANEKSWAFSYVQRPNRPHVIHVVRSPGNNRVSVTQTVNSDIAKENVGPLKIPGKSKIGIAHFVAQVDTVKDIQTALSRFSVGRALADVPYSLRRILANFSSGIAIEGLSIPRESESDLVVLRSGKTLLGEVTDQSFLIETIAGPQNLARDMVIGMQLRGSVGEWSALVGCLDKQVFAGTIKQKKLGFKLSSGQQLQIKMSMIRSIGMKTKDDEARSKKVRVPGKFIRLRTGDALGVEDLGKPVQIVTRYGPLSLKLKSIAQLFLEEPSNWGHGITMANGSRMGCLVTNPALEVMLTNTKNAEGNKAVTIRLDLILQIMDSVSGELARPPAGYFHIEMKNNDKLICRLKSDKLNLESDFGTIAMTSNDMRRLDFNAEGRLEAKLWAGSQLAGKLSEHSLPMEMAGIPLTIPVNLISNMVQHSFKLPEDIEKEVKQLITNLDAADFEERARAEALLTKLGQLVRPYLDQAIRAEDNSPEKKLRIKAVLKELGVDEGEMEINLAEIRKVLKEQKSDEKVRQGNLARALKSIWKAQRIFHDEDRDKDDAQNYGDLAALAKHIGKEHGIDEALGKGKKYGYVFETGPSSNERAAEYMWWAVARPAEGTKGAHYFINHSGTIFVAKEAFKVNKATCDRPEKATRLQE